MSNSPDADRLVAEAQRIAELFHETYERLAPAFGYQTREASRKPWADVPEQNKRLMVAVCGEILSALQQAQAPPTCVCTIDDGLVREWVQKAREVAKSKGYQFEQAQPRPEIGARLRQLAARMEQRGNVIGGDYGHYRAPADPEILKWADELLKLAEQFAAPPRERGEWEPIIVEAANWLDRLRASFKRLRHDSEGDWLYAQEACGAENIAAKLRALLPAPPAPPAEGRTE